MSVPFAKTPTGRTGFPDGSIAFYRTDLREWVVACGADAAMNDPAAECEAAAFCRHTNERARARTPEYAS